MTITQIADQPVYVLNIGAQLSDQEVRAYLAQLEALIKASEPFGCIFQYSAGSPKKSKLGHQLENNWLKQYKPQFGQTCYGIALISNPSVFSALQKIVLKGLGQRFLGPNCNLFHELGPALVWLENRALVSP